jgi:hypothetical protein
LTQRDPRPVPPPPYFHGTKADLQPGHPLEPGTVADGPDDDRLRVWATSDLTKAREWSAKRGPYGGAPQVYEVHLTDPEVDTNVHRPYNAGREKVHSVMAKTGHVIGRVVPKDAPGGDG